jgi:antitoxin component of MazEF toxin-antitoxin module
MKSERISLQPGAFKGMGITRNYNAKPPKIGGGQGVVPPKKISKALGVSVGQAVHANALKQLFTHPDMGVSSTAKRLYNNMNQHNVKASKKGF